MRQPTLPTAAQIITRTPRLILRTWTAADVDPITAVWSDAETMRHAGVVPPDRITRALAAGLAAQAQHGVCLWAVDAQGEGLIGDCGFHPHPEGLELAYHLNRRVWGRGYATEAARAAVAYAVAQLFGGARDAMPMASDDSEMTPHGIPMASSVAERAGSSIIAWVHPDNPRSARVLHRLGFTDEGPDPAEQGEVRYRLVARHP